MLRFALVATIFARYRLLHLCNWRIATSLLSNFIFCKPKYQIRLDFESFTITGPTTITNSIAKRVAKSGVVNGETIGDGVASVADFGNCRTDTFSVTNPDGPSPPTICGVNSGEHSENTQGKCYKFALTFFPCLSMQCMWKPLNVAMISPSSLETQQLEQVWLLGLGQ